jgi:pimeloyl-ACP methyl ester carboxylesterase
MRKSSVRESRISAYAAGVAGLITLAGAGAVAAAELRTRNALKSDPQWALLHSPLPGAPLSVRSADGTPLHAEVFGPDGAPTFLLAPGWTEDLHFFDLLTRGLLGRGYRVVGYDLRGQGSSSGGPGAGGSGVAGVELDQRIDRYGEDVEAVLAASCPGRDDVIVVGHSMGGMAIVAWAASHVVEGRVRAAALVSTGMSNLVEELALLPAAIPLVARRAILEPVLGGSLPLVHLSTPISRWLNRYLLFGPDATAAHIAFIEPMIWGMDPKLRAGAAAAMRDMDLAEALSGLTVPTLVVAGELDRLTPPAHSRRMVAALPHVSEFVLLPETGHMVPLERPDELLAALVELAESVGLSAG